MRFRISGLLLVVPLVIALGLVNAYSEQTDFHASVLEVFGITRVTRGDTTFVIARGAILHDGDQLSVEKGTITLKWPDGSRARLVAGTKVTLTNAPQATRFKAALTHINVQAGAIFLNAVPRAPRPSRFELRTNKSMGAVEGTLVECSYDPTKQKSSLRVWRGAVQCTLTSDKPGITRCELVRAGWSHSHKQDGKVEKAVDVRIPANEAWPGP